MTRVWFVRHAQPDLSNHDELARGLSPKGQADYELVTHYLNDKRITSAYSSPYKRVVDTIKPFADANHLEIQLVDAFRERKISNGWISDFDAFCKRQWLDFDYKLDGGESLREVQRRNAEALIPLLDHHRSEKILIGSHGTAMSTVINYYCLDFGYESFRKIKGLMLWIVCLEFDSFRFLGMHSNTHSITERETVCRKPCGICRRAFDVNRNLLCALALDELDKLNHRDDQNG